MVRAITLAPYASTAVPAGRLLWRDGDRIQALPYLESGRLAAVLRPGDGATEVVPVTFRQGEIAGLSQLFGARRVAFDLAVVDAARVRWLPIARLEQAAMQQPELLLSLARFLADRLRDAQKRERTWLERGVQARVRATLARIAQEHGGLDGEASRLTATHEQLAMRCGISRSKLSQELKHLEASGALRLRRGAIELIGTTLTG